MWSPAPRMLAATCCLFAFFLVHAVPASSQPTARLADGYEIQVDPSVRGRYVFAHGYGLIYSPLSMTRSLRVLETKYPNAKIEWQNIFTTQQQRDAMLAGRLDFGSCSPGPYLQAWDKGVEWKWVQVTSAFDDYLMVLPDGPSSILDFIGTGKKMSPGPNTAPYFATQEVLRKHGKPVKALDLNWANLPHPDAMQALVAGQLDGHWATVEYAIQLRERGMKEIASFRSIYGSLYAVGACALTKTIEEKGQITRGYAEALRQTVTWMKSHPEQAAEILSKDSARKVSPENFLRYLKSGTFELITRDGDVRGQWKSMHDLGVIKRSPGGVADFYAFPEHAGARW